MADQDSANGGIRWNKNWVNVSITCVGEYVGLVDSPNANPGTRRRSERREIRRWRIDK